MPAKRSPRSPSAPPPLLPPPLTRAAARARTPRSRGVDLVRVEVCPDAPDDIAASVRSLSERVGPDGFVFTSGGIGTTHDDVTYGSVAAAFGVGLEVHEGTRVAMEAHYRERGKELNAARLRMATLPAGCAVHATPGLWVPLVQLRNVYVLPGVPWLFAQMLEANRGLFSGPRLHSAVLYSHQGEGELAEALTGVAGDHPAVSIGSYPNTARGEPKAFQTKLTFDGRDAGALAAAVAAARACIATFDGLPPAAEAAGGAAGQQQPDPLAATAAG